MNSTTKRFPRASRDNCLYSAEVLAGPYGRKPWSVSTLIVLFLASIIFVLAVVSW